MNPTQVKSFFIQFFGENFELYGLLVELISVRYIKETKRHEFYFEISNPNDISYYKTPFEWKIIEMLNEFERYFPINSEFIVDFVDNGGVLYFNSDKTKEIQDAFNKINTIKFTTGNPFIGYRRYEMKIQSIRYETHLGHVEIRIDNVAKVVESTKNGESCDKNEVIQQYYNEFLPNDESYWESEVIYTNLDPILLSIPSIGGHDVLLEYNTVLFRK